MLRRESSKPSCNRSMKPALTCLDESFNPSDFDLAQRLQATHQHYKTVCGSMSDAGPLLEMGSHITNLAGTHTLNVNKALYDLDSSGEPSGPDSNLFSVHTEHRGAHEDDATKVLIAASSVQSSKPALPFFSFLLFHLFHLRSPHVSNSLSAAFSTLQIRGCHLPMTSCIAYTLYQGHLSQHQKRKMV